MARRADKAKLGLTGVDPKDHRTAQEILAAQYTECFTSSAGSAVYKDLQLRFQRRRSYVQDSNATAFHEGQRDVVRMIENFLDPIPQPTTEEEQ